ncbi:hypothetical protein B0H17DRAFT_1213087 [Mycena rosella]|uniref:Uncharacterized protein n=1 Tax=Mycena rosella TaxID=1033263 RepID=A0AAD7CR36_MYCRO|nr:hypothetical protein B0H17DRAFT_1213087 [Mycena rosella]
MCLVRNELEFMKLIQNWRALRRMLTHPHDMRPLYHGYSVLDYSIYSQQCDREMMEQYLKGIAEYGSSVKSRPASVCVGEEWNVPRRYPRQYVDTYFWDLPALGWTYTAGTAQWVLLPGTFVATTFIVLVAVHGHAGDIPHESDPFDPSNPLHLIAAAAAVGLNNTFNGVDDEEMNQRAKLSVVLTSVPGKGPTFICAESYRAAFSDAVSPRGPYTRPDDLARRSGARADLSSPTVNDAASFSASNKRPARTPGMTASSAGPLVPEQIRKKFSGPNGWKIHVPLNFLTDDFCSFTNHAST